MSHIILRKTKAITVVSLVLLTLLLGAASGYSNPNFDTAEPEMFGRCWDFKTAPNLGVSPLVDKSAIYFVDSDNRLLALDSTSAARIWSSELGGEVVSNLLLSDPSILIVTNSQATEGSSAPKTVLRSISRETGITEWQAEIKSSSSVWIGAYPDVIVAVGDAGAISELGRTDGKILWMRDLGATVTTSPMFGVKGIALGTERKEIFDVAIADGSLRPLWKSDYLPTALAVDNSGRLVVGDDRGNVTAISAAGERSWTFRNGARISSIVLSESEYIASSNDNFVYRLTRGGNVKWKRRLPGRLAQAPLLLDDVAVMSVSGGGGVFVLDMNKGKILDRIEIAEELSFAIGATPNASKNFIIAGPSTVSYFSREKCPANKKTTPGAVS